MFDRSTATEEAAGASCETTVTRAAVVGGAGAADGGAGGAGGAADGGAGLEENGRPQGGWGTGGIDPVVDARDEEVLAQTRALRLLAGRINAAHAEMVDRLVEFTVDDWWNRASGWRDLTHWLVVNCGMTKRSAAELCVVVEAARAGLMPSVMQCARDGEVSVGMAAMAARVACPENDAALANIATTATAPQAAQAFRWYRRVVADPESEPEPESQLDPESELDFESQPGPEPESGRRPGPESDPEPESGTQPDSESEPAPEPEPEPEPESQAKHGPESEPVPAPQPEPASESPRPIGPDPTSDDETWWRTWTDPDGHWRVSGKAPIEIGALLDEAYEAARRFAQRGLDLPDPNLSEFSDFSDGAGNGSPGDGARDGSPGDGREGEPSDPGVQSARGGQADANGRVPVPRTYEVLRHLARLVLDGARAHRLTREGGEPFTVNVLIDIDTLVTGVVHPGSVCEFSNGTELTPPVVRMLAESGALQLLWHQKGVPLKLGESVRLATPEQRKLLRLQYGGCALPGCGQSRYLHYHHIVPFPEGPTDIDNLVPLCGREHRAVHAGHLSIERGPDGWLTFRDSEGQVIGNRLVEQLRGTGPTPATASPNPRHCGGDGGDCGVGGVGGVGGGGGSRADDHDGLARQRPPLGGLEDSLSLDHINPLSAWPKGGGERAGVEAINNWITALLWRPTTETQP